MSRLHHARKKLQRALNEFSNDIGPGEGPGGAKGTAGTGRLSTPAGDFSPTESRIEQYLEPGNVERMTKAEMAGFPDNQPADKAKSAAERPPKAAAGPDRDVNDVRPEGKVSEGGNGSLLSKQRLVQADR